MKTITDEQIKQHIIGVVDNELNLFADRHLMNDYKSKILNNKETDAVDYIAKKIIGDMDRNLLNIEKRVFDINKIDLRDLIDYLKSDDFPFKEYLQEAIKNKLYEPGVWSENCNKIIDMNSFISAIVSNLHILNLVKEDERLNLAKKENAEKIENAINTLLDYTNDYQVQYYLKTIRVQTRNITVNTILSCIFCSLYKMLEEMITNLNKSKIQENIIIIMQQVFNTQKEYRYYKNTENINFKGYKLRKFKAK